MENPAKCRISECKSQVVIQSCEPHAGVVGCSLQHRGAGAQSARSLHHAQLQRVVEFSQLLLGLSSFGHFREQCVIGRFDFTLHTIELSEDGDFRTEDVRVDWLVQVIDRSRAIAVEHVLVFVVVGGQEDNRNQCGLLALLDHASEFDAGHARHTDVQDEKCELIHEQGKKSLVGRLGFNQPVLGVV